MTFAAGAVGDKHDVAIVDKDRIAHVRDGVTAMTFLINERANPRRIICRRNAYPTGQEGICAAFVRPISRFPD